MAAGSIIVDLLMRTGSFETDTKKAQKRLRELEAEAKKVGAAIGTAFAAAATATAYFVKSSIDAADAAIKNAQAIGLTVEAYTELAFAADLSGISQDEMGVALTRLARLAAEAAGGSKTAAAGFDTLGISLRTADGAIKDTDQLLTEIAGKFAGYADGTAKTALATEFFGRAGAKMIPLLNGGADGMAALRKEAAELGIVMDTQTAKAAEQLNDDVTRLGAVVRGFGNDLMRAAVPALQATATAMLEMRRQSVQAGESLPMLTGMLNGLALEAARSTAQLYILGLEFGEVFAKAEVVARSLKDLAFGNTSNMDVLRRAWAGFDAISEGVKADVDRARDELKRFEYALSPEGQAATRLGSDPRELARRGRGPGTPAALAAPTIPRLPALNGGKSAVDEAARYLENLRKQLQATKDMSVAETLLADIQAGRLGKVTAAQEAELRGVAQQIDMARRRGEEFKAEAEQERAFHDNQAAIQRELAQIYDDTRTPLEQLNIELARLAQLRTVAGANLDALARAEFDAWDRYEQQVQKTAETMDEFSKTMAENVQSFLGGAFADVMEGNFKSIGQAFTQMVNRMVAEALAADLARRLFGSASGGSGSGWVGAAMSALGSYFGGAKAGGGDVMPGRDYWVGENGPERFRPRTMGTILPAAAGGAGGGRSLVVNNAFTVSGAVDRRTQMQLAAEVSRAVSSAQRRNG